MNYLNEVLDFLRNLQANNNKEWFNQHRKDYERARDLFEKWTMELGVELEKMDPTFQFEKARRYTFRIHRDLRFSKDKTPYSTHMGAFLSAGSKKELKAGYYFHLQNGGSFFGGGIYMPPKEILDKVRREIYFSPTQFEEIINKTEFRSFFPELMDDKLQRFPKEYAHETNLSEWIKYKSFAVSKGFDEGQVSNNPQLKNHILLGFKSMVPFNQFINKTLD
jgi:uncharacterized protein (TIGR02453 family)